MSSEEIKTAVHSVVPVQSFILSYMAGLALNNYNQLTDLSHGSNSIAIGDLKRQYLHIIAFSYIYFLPEREKKRDKSII